MRRLRLLALALATAALAGCVMPQRPSGIFAGESVPPPPSEPRAKSASPLPDRPSSSAEAIPDEPRRQPRVAAERRPLAVPARPQ